MSAKLMCIFIASTSIFLIVVNSCSYPSPEESFQTYVQQLDSSYCHLFSAEAILADYENAFLENPIPDSTFWSNRAALLEQAETQLASFRYLPEQELLLQKDWQNQLATTHKKASLLRIYERQAIFEHLLYHSTLMEIEKLQAFDYQLRTYSYILQNFKSKIKTINPQNLDKLEQQLTKSYFFLTEKLPQETRLEHQLEHIQSALQPKIEAARLAIKDLLAFCRSFENQAAN